MKEAFRQVGRCGLEVAPIHAVGKIRASVRIFIPRVCIALLAVGFPASILATPTNSASNNPLLGLPPLPIPADNPQTPAKIALGRKIFFDARFSPDRSIRCATCHDPARAFSDGRSVARGFSGRSGLRNAPSLVMAAYNTSQFWDGRRATLEAQAIDPLVNPIEHGFSNTEDVLKIVRDDPHYVDAFKRVFGVNVSAISEDHVAKAIAAFERTLVAGNSAFDRYFYSGDKSALSDTAARGLALFRGTAGCSACHSIGEHDATFTDQGFHNLRVGFSAIQKNLAQTVSRAARLPLAERMHRVSDDPDLSQLGRFVVTLQPADIGKFKTPSLRNVDRTAPYMHDGSIDSLDEAVAHEIYYRGLEGGRPLILTPAERADLVEFLKALTSPETAEDAATK